jgi:hypothetical protein
MHGFNEPMNYLLLKGKRNRVGRRETMKVLLLRDTQVSMHGFSCLAIKKAQKSTSRDPKAHLPVVEIKMEWQEKESEDQEEEVEVIVL